MQRQSLATKYRPRTWGDVVGQSLTIELLKRGIEQGRLKNAYLFAGASGTGKTTVARIFANAINEGHGSPIEIDAASNNGVDQVRAIVEDANKRSLDSEYKIYVIDECQAITSAGWDAFLKGIEEPPAYTIFVFCTTEPDKLPLTIQNRLQRYDFSPVPANLVKNRLIQVCQAEGFSDYEAACDLISKNCDGCVRDALMTLDRCSDYSRDLGSDVVKKMVGSSKYEAMFKLTWALQDKDEAAMLGELDSLDASGQNMKAFVDSYLSFALDLSKYSLFRDVSMTDIPGYLATSDNPVVQQTVQPEGSANWLLDLVDALLEIKAAIKYDSSYKATMAAYLLRFMRGKQNA